MPKRVAHYKTSKRLRERFDLTDMDIKVLALLGRSYTALEIEQTLEVNKDVVRESFHHIHQFYCPDIGSLPLAVCRSGVQIMPVKGAYLDKWKDLGPSQRMMVRCWLWNLSLTETARICYLYQPGSSDKDYTVENERRDWFKIFNILNVSERHQVVFLLVYAGVIKPLVKPMRGMIAKPEKFDAAKELREAKESNLLS